MYSIVHWAHAGPVPWKIEVPSKPIQSPSLGIVPVSKQKESNWISGTLPIGSSVHHSVVALHLVSGWSPFLRWGGGPGNF